MKLIRHALGHRVSYKSGAYEQMIDELRLEPVTPQATLILLEGNASFQMQAAAREISRRLGKRLYRVDLSPVSSKYIGETEKNLDALFDRATSLGWILFFDEADALFGKRTGVRDAHDRYANQEVNYFLQRTEHYRGMIIVSTHRKTDLLEKARYMRKIWVKFPPFG